MSYSYQTEFAQAVERTRSFGLDFDEMRMTNRRVLTTDLQQEFPLAIRDAIGELSLEDVVAQCLAIHWRVKEPLEQLFGVPIAYTIGHVFTPPSFMFQQTEEELRALMRAGVQNGRVNIHAWLTLPSHEIIDMSLSTSLAIIQKLDQGRGAVIAKHPDDFVKGLRYHPMLVGHEYLERIGAMQSYILQ